MSDFRLIISKKITYLVRRKEDKKKKTLEKLLIYLISLKHYFFCFFQITSSTASTKKIISSRKLYQAFIFSIPIFFTFILLLLFYLFYLRRWRVDWASLRMRSSMHDNANHTSGVCFPVFAVLQFGAFFICLIDGKNVRNMERS